MNGRSTEVLVEVMRGDVCESLHRGDAVIVDVTGKVLFSAGDPQRMVFLRSAAKPFQAMTVVESGAVERYGLTTAEVAVMAASHSGEAGHLQAVGSILRKIDLGPVALACGVHAPLDFATWQLLHEGQGPGPLHNNCSGKHAGMLAACLHLGWPIEDYLAADHPLQVRNRQNLAFMAGLADELVTATDGCGSPTHAMPLAAMARAFARLAQPAGVPPAKEAAARTVSGAMRLHPELVGGSGRLCTRLMQAAGEQLVAKSGAEGVYGIGLNNGWGLALKIEDGSSRAMGPAVIESLAQVGMLPQPVLAALADLHAPVLRNHRGDVCGRVRPVGKLRCLS